MSTSPVDLSAFDKRSLLDSVDAQLRGEIEAATARARATAASATHEEARAEDDKDTRAIEESYLARGQAQRVADLEHDRALLRSMELRPRTPNSPVVVGSLVRIEDDDGVRTVLLVPAGGGRRIEALGESIQLVTPNAPLGAALIGSRVDDDFELNLRGKVREVVVVAVG